VTQPPQAPGQRLRAAYETLARGDPVLGELADRLGHPDPFAWTGQERTQVDPFEALVLHVVGQQISIKAALTIYDRLRATAGAVTPKAILAAGPGQLRATGLSAAKSAAVAALAGAISTGTLDLSQLRTLDDETALDHLVAQRGIGPWTAQMFLIHRLHRPDVLPSGDVGLQEAIHRAYSLARRPNPRDAAERAAAWLPYRTYAAAILWRSVGA
jgi:DNA-3-methyladenine glycosylase II